MHDATDTIAAIATPAGRGGIGVVRLSGEQVPAIGTALLGVLPSPRHAELHDFRDAQGDVIDRGLVLYFPAPHSFTGEPVLELHGHGGPVVMDLLLARVLELGARMARPGEFTERAFLNDKLDLAQAEAVADLIEAGSARAARAAMGSLQGEFSRRVTGLVEQLVELRVYVEGAMDFPEDEIDFLADGRVAQRLDQLVKDLDELLTTAQQGQLLRDGMTLVIAGLPNAGKSSLLNALAGEDRAIVTHIAGTTRDVIRERIAVDGMPLHVVDTAGLRDSDDPVEQEGVKRAWQAIASADHALLVVDDQLGMGHGEQAALARFPASLSHTIVLNKIDLTSRTPGRDASGHVAVSARTGAGLEELRDYLKHCMGYDETATSGFIARRRHLDALRRGRDAIDEGRRQLQGRGAGELLAEELRAAQRALGEITGEFTNEDLLDRIFSSFCIGK